MADVSAGGKFLSMGHGTHRIPLALFADNRSRLIDRLKADGRADQEAVILLEGGNDVPLYNTDVDFNFRQEPFFQWAFGVREPGCAGAIQLSTGKAVLFIPRLPEEYAIWMGELPTCSGCQETYGVDEVRFIDESLEACRESADVIFLTKLVSGEIDCPFVLEKLPLSKY